MILLLYKYFVIFKTLYNVDLELIKTAWNSIIPPVTINEPTGRFFYDKWKLKPEFVGTAWQLIYDSLPEPKGEARIIRLVGGSGYIGHADIDDRYHLNLTGKKSFIIDLEKNIMHSLTADGHWYNMDAGIIHTAVNFGNFVRDQLVIRQLLKENHLVSPINIKIISTLDDLDEARYIMDNAISPWLNRANKNGLITNFNHDGKSFTLSIEKDQLSTLQELCTDNFAIVYQ